MNYNLNEIYVNKHDPFFTADKWNDSLSYSQNFEKMLNKFFGGTFKGLYKPFLSYDIYDYVWFNNDYYQVVDTNNTDTEFFNKSNYKNVVYYKNNQFIGLNEKGQIVVFDKSNINIISSSTFQKIHLHDDDIIALGNQKLYKVDVVAKTTNVINYIFARTINDIKRDKFQIYIVTNNTIEVGNTLNNDMTETKKLYETNRRIVDTALNDTHILVLLDNNNVDIINKSTGKKDGYFTISQSINLQKVKTVCIDDYSYLVYDGNNKILTFNKTGNIYNYYSFISNPNFVGTTSLTSNNNYIVTTNPTTITKLIATRYSLSVVDIKSIIIKDLVSKKSNVIAEYIDFSKGQYETDTLKPISSTIKAYNNKGVAIKNSLSYNYNLTNKTIMFRLEANSNVNGNVLSIKIGNKNISIQASNITGEHYYAVILLSDKYKVAHYHNDIKNVTIHNYPIMSSSENKFTFSSSTEYILKNFIIFKNSVEAESLIDFYYRNDLSSFDIQASTKSYPYSYVKTDENGNINLNIQDKSILKASNGFKVNMSSNTSLKDRDIALNMEGANRLKSEIDKETLELANTKLDKSNVSVDYNTAKKIEDKIKENKSYSDKELQKVNSNLQSSIETTKNNLTNSINTKLNKGNVSSEYDSAKKIEDKIKSNKTYSDNEIKKINTNISSVDNKLTDVKNNLWKISPKYIGSSSSTFDLNNLKERGFYVSSSSGNKFTNCPLGSQGAFELTVSGISNGSYCTQTLKEISTNNYWVRTQTNWQEPWTWTNWTKIIDSNGGTISGSLTIAGNIVGNGTANISGLLTANDIYLTSDINEKTNLNKINNPLEKLNKINGYLFEWIKTGKKSGGVIAQEVEKILPSIVYTEEYGKKVNYNGIIALLIEANKELIKKIEVLESKVR